MRRLVFATFLALSVAGCSGLSSHTEVEALTQATAVGSPFTQRLTQEYRVLVKSLQRSLDYSDARHFAKKGLMAAEGKVVLPEPLSNWHLNRDSSSTLRAARNRLVALLDGGGRVQAPFESAVAQSRFDCWIEQEEEHWLGHGPTGCQKQFDTAIKELEERVTRAMPKSDKEGAPLPTPVVTKEKTNPEAVANTMDEGMFLVFFDWNQSKLTASGMDVVRAVAEQAKKRPDLKRVTIIGHADTSGPDKYNQKLSERRAEATKQALIGLGVAPLQIQTEGRGEHELMVPTPNNTREPANRRSEVRFE